MSSGSPQKQEDLLCASFASSTSSFACISAREQERAAAEEERIREFNTNSHPQVSNWLQSVSDSAPPEEGAASPKSDQGNQSISSSDISTKQPSGKQEDADNHKSAPSYPAPSEADSSKAADKVNTGPDHFHHKLYSQSALNSGQRDSHHSKSTTPPNEAEELGAEMGGGFERE